MRRLVDLSLTRQVSGFGLSLDRSRGFAPRTSPQLGRIANKETSK